MSLPSYQVPSLWRDHRVAGKSNARDAKATLRAELGIERQYVRGEGCYLWDTAGERFLDFVAQYGALPFGHHPPRLWEAVCEIRRQATPNLAIGSASLAADQLRHRLCELAAGDFRHAILCNTGTEGVETAFKFARAATNRNQILATTGGFHGQTLAAFAASDRRDDHRTVGIAASDFVPFGDAAALAMRLSQEPKRYAALIVEPVQGRGRMSVAPEGYLAAASQMCRQFGTKLILDEVHTGLGRTGHLWGCEDSEVRPDILVCGKALGGGMVPISAVLLEDASYVSELDLQHGSTFAGNQLAVAAAMTTLDLLTENNGRLVDQIQMNSRLLWEQLRRLQCDDPRIADIRGKGFLVGVQFDSAIDRDPVGKDLNDRKLLVALVANYLLHVKKIRVAVSLPRGDVLRIEPPLIAGPEEILAFADALRSVSPLLAAGAWDELMVGWPGEQAAGSW